MPQLSRRDACTAIVGLLIAPASIAVAQSSTATKATPVAKPIKPLPPGVVLIQLDDLHCKTCARKLASKLYAVPGVVRVKANLKQDTATITLQKKKTVAPAKLWDAVIAAKLAPVELRVADRRLTAKDFPKAKTAAKNPHAGASKR